LRAKTIFENSSEPAEKRAFLNYLLQNPTVKEKKLYFSIKNEYFVYFMIKYNKYLYFYGKQFI